jgi:hypothetical protein
VIRVRRIAPTKVAIRAMLTMLQPMAIQTMAPTGRGSDSGVDGSHLVFVKYVSKGWSDLPLLKLG